MAFASAGFAECVWKGTCPYVTLTSQKLALLPLSSPTPSLYSPLFERHKMHWAFNWCPDQFVVTISSLCLLNLKFRVVPALPLPMPSWSANIEDGHFLFCSFHSTGSSSSFLCPLTALQPRGRIWKMQCTIFDSSAVPHRQGSDRCS